MTALFSKAQLPTGPFNIVNGTGCNIQVRWTIMDNTCGTSCYGSVGAVTIPANNQITIPATDFNLYCSGNAFDVIVTFLGSNGTAFSTSYTINSTTTTYPANETNYCLNLPYSYSLSGNAGGVYFN